MTFENDRALDQSEDEINVTKVTLTRLQIKHPGGMLEKLRQSGDFLVPIEKRVFNFI